MIKRILSIALAFLMIAIMVSGCGKGGGNVPASDTPADTSAPADQTESDSAEPEDTDSPAVGDRGYVIKDVSVIDDENCSFTVTGAEDDDFWGFTLKVLCENRMTDKTLTFSLENVVVNGYMEDPFWAEDVTPGEKSNDSVSFPSDMLERIGSSEAEEISFTLSVSDADDWFADDIARVSYTVYPTGLDADSVKRPERPASESEKVIIDDDRYTLIIFGKDDDGYFGPALDCYVENKTDENLSFTLDDVSVNGFMVDSIWVHSVVPGARCRADLTLSEEDLADNGIENVEKVRFKFSVSSADDFFAENLFEATYTYEP